MAKFSRKISIAPMMACTDRHFRYFMRLINPEVLLYTEMVTSGAIIHGDRQRFLNFDASEHPVALQLGGSNPAELAKCAKIAEEWNYDEINLNVGCPSDRVQSGSFGACLFKQPELVAECLSAMRSEVSMPVTVKTRIGVDEIDRYEDLVNFVKILSEQGTSVFIIHARKAWLKGLNPKQNRTVPPLVYERVYQLKKDFPQLEIIINGGIKTHDEIEEHLRHVDGVMIGRVAYEHPYFLAPMGASSPPSRFTVLKGFLPYIERQHAEGVPLRQMMRHTIGVFHGLPGAKQWRCELTSPQLTYAKLVEMLAQHQDILKKL